MLASIRPIDRMRRITFVVLLALIFTSVNGAFIGVATSPTTADVVDYAQCANGAPPSTSTACPEGWINGILNTNNSHYAEDQVTPQRAEVLVPQGSPATGRTLTFRYQTRKGTIHAYDSLATWNFTQTTADRCQGLSAAECVGGSPSTFPIPADPTVVADTGAGSATSLHQLPGQVMTMYGGTITGISVPSHDNAAGPGDDWATVVVTYSVANTAAARLVQLLFGGHLAPSTGPRGWGSGLGAGNVSGGPYHIKWEAADGDAIGNRDNQIMADAILAPSLSITKTADAASVNAGSPIGFTITVSNTGAGPATNVAVTDALPTGSGISWSESPDNTSCSIASNTLTCTFPSIAVGASASVHVVSPTTGASCGTYNNTAQFSSADGSGQSTASVTVNCQPDVTVSKSGNGPLTAGATATFSITVSAGGTGSSTNVTLSDTLPTGTWTLSGPDAAQCAIAAGTLTCNFGTMASGTTKTVSLSRATTGGDCPSITNTATVTATGDTNTGNNSATATIVVNCQPDVSVTKSGNGPLTAGQTATFTITVSAGGTGSSTNVTLSDTLPTGTWTLSGADAAQCSIASGALSCNFGTMASGTSKVVTLSRATTGGDCPSIANTATVNATGDTNLGNNSSSATITVNCQPDVTVAKTGNGPLSAGATATFTITVTAGGSGTSSNVTLSDTLPSGTWTLSGADAASCGIASGTLTCSFGSMASGTSKVVTLSRATTGGDCPSIANTATVNAAGDTNANNNSASATIIVNCAPDVSILKSGSSAVSAGEAVTFTITVSAGGTGPSSNVTVTDTLPSGTWTLGGTDAAACGTGSGTLTCNFGTMAQGTSRTVTLSRASTAQDCPAINNTAVVTATGDTNTENNSSTAGVTVNCGQITMAKTADNGTVNAGGTIGFLIAIANLGDGTATGVTVSDTLPTGGGLAWTIDTAASDPGCTITSGVLTCSFGALAPSESRNVHLTSPTTAEECGTVRNVATATTENDGDAEASASIVVNCQPDVSVTKSGNGPLTAGQTATFTVTVSAGGTGPSSNVTLSDTLPAGTWTLGGADAASCTLASSTLSCSFGTMASGTSRTITLSRASTTGDCSTPIANTANVNATSDSNTQNNTSSASISVTCPPPPQSPQLIVSKTADATLVTAGAQGTAGVGFSVTVTNNGFIPTTALLTDTPLVSAAPSTPAGNAGTLGLTWTIDAAGSDAGCSIASNTLTCNFGTLQPGASKHVHITAPVTGRTSAASRTDNCGQLVDNVATVTLGNGNALQSNHATVNIACLPTTSAGALTIRKYADNNADALQGAGESNLAGWTFEVKNNATGEVRTATTGANGSITVNDLAFGDYTITEKSCTSPCDLSKWKPISYVITGQITVSNRSGVAQITISAADQTITFGNQPPLLPSTSTGDNGRDRIQAMVLLLLAALVAQVLVLRVVARLSARE